MSKFKVDSALNSAETVSFHNANPSDVAYYRKASQGTLGRAESENQISIPCSLQIAEKLCKKIFTVYHPFRDNKAPLAAAVWKQEVQQYYRRITGEEPMKEQTVNKYDPEKLKAEFKALKIKAIVAAQETGISTGMISNILNGSYAAGSHVVTQGVQKLIDYIQKKKLDGGADAQLTVEKGGGVAAKSQCDDGIHRREVGRELPASLPIVTMVGIADQIYEQLKGLPDGERLTVLHILVKLHNPRFNIEER